MGLMRAALLLPLSLETERYLAQPKPQQALPGGCPLAVAGAASAGCC